MSSTSSIDIYNTAKVYETRQQSAKDHSQSPMSSSSSTYSSSPQTPSSANPSKSAQKQKQKAVHERRQSLLSMFAISLLTCPAQAPHLLVSCNHHTCRIVLLHD